MVGIVQQALRRNRLMQTNVIGGFSLGNAGMTILSDNLSFGLGGWGCFGRLWC